MSTYVSLSALHTWSYRGERAFDSAPRLGENVTLLMSVRNRIRAAETAVRNG